MPDSRFDKLFSAEEVNELIPRLEVLMRELQMTVRQMRARIAELSKGEPALLTLELPEILERFPELRAYGSALAETVSQIEAFGCILKDVDQGLLDFPFDMGEEVVFLCWQYGEPQVVAWHSIDGGFANRQPLPGVRKTYLN